MGGLGALGAISPIGAVAQAAVGDLVTELSSFTKFRERIEEILRDLKGSPAGPEKVGQDPVVRSHFGGDTGQWAEAGGLYKSYSTVIEELEKLSKLLADSIEGLSIAVLASHKGYEHVDLDIRERMLAIQSSTNAHYAMEQAAKQQGASTKTVPMPEHTAF
ncbi:hypothetical protein [Streptomyces sp. NPDC006971]|uniref:hypothetical protein n=1 Tax=Streptomyces sp. NPDC006971 TaxID=3154784 RepID=UPI0033F3E166